MGDAQFPAIITIYNCNNSCWYNLLLLASLQFKVPLLILATSSAIPVSRLEVTGNHCSEI
jgi:hypothetical protein